MSTEINWYIPGRVLYACLSGHINEANLASFNTDLNEALHLLRSPVHLVLDTQNVQHIDARLQQLSHSLDALQHPQLGWLALVSGANTGANFTFSTLAQVFNARFRRFESPEEALTFLYDLDDTLAGLTVAPQFAELGRYISLD